MLYIYIFRNCSIRSHFCSTLWSELQLYMQASFPGLQLARLCLPEPFVALFQVSGAAVCCHFLSHSKISLVGAWCIHNLFFTYQPSFPPLGFLSSSDGLPIVLCSLPLPSSPHLPLLLRLSPLERQLFSRRPDERLRRTIKMLFKCKGVCVRVRDISCWKWAAASW